MYKSNIIAATVLLIADLIWIGTFMAGKYQAQIRVIQGVDMTVRPVFAVLSYTLMVIGLNLFVLPRIRKGRELQDSLLYGALFGIVLYGVYDFTAAAVLKKWDIKLALIDVMWGGFVYFAAAYIGSIMS